MKAWTQLLEPGPALSTICLLLVLSSQSYAAPTLPDEHAEQSTEIEYYPVADATGCYYNFQHYDEGDRIITNEPCLNCTCHNRMLMCYLKVCPFTKAIGANCKVEKRPDQCCPVITCPEVPVQLVTSTVPSTALGHLNEYGCSIDNLFYSDGARVPSNPDNPCELCYCIRNKTACVMQECTLNVDGCRPVFQEGVCCPVRYHCEHPDYLEGPTTPQISTTTTTTTTVAPTTTLPSVECFFQGQSYNDGELVKKDIPCEKCYCLKGDIVCAVQECGPTPLDKVNCTALPIREGQCCPENYDCAGIIEEELTTLSSVSYDTEPTTLPTVDLGLTQGPLTTAVQEDIDEQKKLEGSTASTETSEGVTTVTTPKEALTIGQQPEEGQQEKDEGEHKTQTPEIIEQVTRKTVEAPKPGEQVTEMLTEQTTRSTLQETSASIQEITEGTQPTETPEIEAVTRVGVELETTEKERVTFVPAISPEEATKAHDTSEKPTTDEGTAKPPGEEETAKPYIEDETAKPTAERETPKPSEEGETTKPSVEGETAKPSLERGTPKPFEEGEKAKPSVEGETAKPSVEGETVKPFVDQKTTKPSVEIETAKPYVEGETVKPSVEGETNKPSEEGETAKPFVDQETTKPSVEIETAKPYVEGETVKPSVEGETDKPSVEGETNKPSEEGETAKPFVDQETTKPSVEIETAKPYVEGETVKPSVEGETAQPSVEGETAKPLVDQETTKPSVDIETVKPYVEGETVKPSVEGETAKPSVGGETAKPSVEGETAKPSPEGETAKPFVDQETTKPSVEIQTAKPYVEGETIKPSVEGETAKPSEEQETTKPYVEEKTPQPVEEETTKPSAEEETVKPLIEGETTIPSVEIKTVKPSIEGETAKPYVEEETAKPSVEGETATSSDKGESTQSSMKEETATPSFERETAKPYVEETSKPFFEEETSKPFFEEETSKPSVDIVKPYVEEETAKPTESPVETFTSRVTDAIESVTSRLTEVVEAITRVMTASSSDEPTTKMPEEMDVGTQAPKETKSPDKEAITELPTATGTYEPEEPVTKVFAVTDREPVFPTAQPEIESDKSGVTPALSEKEKPEKISEPSDKEPAVTKPSVSEKEEPEIIEVTEESAKGPTTASTLPTEEEPTTITAEEAQPEKEPVHDEHEGMGKEHETKAPVSETERPGVTVENVTSKHPDEHTEPSVTERTEASEVSEQTEPPRIVTESETESTDAAATQEAVTEKEEEEKTRKPEVIIEPTESERKEPITETKPEKEPVPVTEEAIVPQDCGEQGCARIPTETTHTTEQPLKEGTSHEPSSSEQPEREQETSVPSEAVPAQTNTTPSSEPETEKTLSSVTEPEPKGPKATEPSPEVTTENEEVVIVTEIPTRKTELPESMDHVSETVYPTEAPEVEGETERIKLESTTSSLEVSEEPGQEYTKQYASESPDKAHSTQTSRLPSATEKTQQTEAPSRGQTEQPSEGTEVTDEPSKLQTQEPTGVTEITEGSYTEPTSQESKTPRAPYKAESSATEVSKQEEAVTQPIAQEPDEYTKLPSVEIPQPTTELPREEDNEIDHEKPAATVSKTEETKVPGEQPTTQVSVSEEGTKDTEVTTHKKPETEEPATEEAILPEVCKSESECVPGPVPSHPEDETESTRISEEATSQSSARPEGTTESNKIPETEEHTEETNEIPEGGTEEIGKVTSVPKDVLSYTEESSGEKPTEIPHKEEEGSGQEPEEGSGFTTAGPHEGGVITETIVKVTEGAEGKPEVTTARYDEGKQSEQPTATEAGTTKPQETATEEGQLTEQPQTEHVPEIRPTEYSETTEYPADTELPEREIPGEGSCLVDGQTYKNNSSVPPINYCQTSCKCVSSILRCESIECTPPPAGMQNCMPIFLSPESCCPTYSCTGPETTSPMESDSHVIQTTIAPSEEVATINVGEVGEPKLPDVVVTTVATEEKEPLASEKSTEEATKPSVEPEKTTELHMQPVESTEAQDQITEMPIVTKHCDESGCKLSSAQPEPPQKEVTEKAYEHTESSVVSTSLETELLQETTKPESETKEPQLEEGGITSKAEGVTTSTHEEEVTSSKPKEGEPVTEAEIRDAGSTTTEPVIKIKPGGETPALESTSQPSEELKPTDKVLVEGEQATEEPTTEKQKDVETTRGTTERTGQETIKPEGEKTVQPETVTKIFDQESSAATILPSEEGETEKPEKITETSTTKAIESEQASSTEMAGIPYSGVSEVTNAPEVVTQESEKPESITKKPEEESKPAETGTTSATEGQTRLPTKETTEPMHVTRTPEIVETESTTVFEYSEKPFEATGPPEKDLTPEATIKPEMATKPSVEVEEGKTTEQPIPARPEGQTEIEPEGQTEKELETQTEKELETQTEGPEEHTEKEPEGQTEKGPEGQTEKASKTTEQPEVLEHATTEVPLLVSEVPEAVQPPTMLPSEGELPKSSTAVPGKEQESQDIGKEGTEGPVTEHEPGKGPEETLSQTTTTPKEEEHPVEHITIPPSESTGKPIESESHVTGQETIEITSPKAVSETSTGKVQEVTVTESPEKLIEDGKMVTEKPSEVSPAVEETAKPEIDLPTLTEGATTKPVPTEKDNLTTESEEHVRVTESEIAVTEILTAEGSTKKPAEEEIKTVEPTVTQQPSVSSEVPPKESTETTPAPQIDETPEVATEVIATEKTSVWTEQQPLASEKPLVTEEPLKTEKVPKESATVTPIESTEEPSTEDNIYPDEIPEKQSSVAPEQDPEGTEQPMKEAEMPTKETTKVETVSPSISIEGETQTTVAEEGATTLPSVVRASSIAPEGEQTSKQPLEVDAVTTLQPEKETPLGGVTESLVTEEGKTDMPEETTKEGEMKPLSQKETTAGDTEKPIIATEASPAKIPTLPDEEGKVSTAEPTLTGQTEQPSISEDESKTSAPEQSVSQTTEKPEEEFPDRGTKRPGIPEESLTFTAPTTQESETDKPSRLDEEAASEQPGGEKTKPSITEDDKTAATEQPSGTEKPGILEEGKTPITTSEEDFLTRRPAEAAAPEVTTPISEEKEKVSEPEHGELFTSGPKVETSTRLLIPGELSTSAPVSEPTTILPATILPTTTSTESSPAHIPGEQVPEPADYEPPEYEDEDQNAFGPGTCRYGGKVYVSAQQIPREDPCDFCFCFRSDIICLQQSCPPPIPRCHEEPIRGFCCPRYECPVSMATAVNVTTSTTTTTTTLPPHFFSHAYKGRASKTGCQINGRAYKVGEPIRATSGPCLHCTCGGDGQMKCDPKPCSPEPMLRQMIAAAASRRRR